MLSSHNCIYQRNDDNTVTLVQELNGNDNLVLTKFVKAGSKLYCLNTEYVYPFAYSEDNGETWALEDSFWWDYANPVNMVQAGNKIVIYSGSESNYFSDDDGNTWTATDLTLDDNNDFRFYNEDTVCQLANGKILGIQPRGRYNQETNTYSAVVCISDDGINFTSIPRTWYDDVEIVLNYTGDKYPWLTQLSNGTILAGCTFTRYMPGTLPNIDTSKIIKSTDNGVTWSLFYEFGDYRIGGEHPYTYRPTVYSVVELEDGTLYAVGTYLVSKDFGNTWEIISEDLDIFASYNKIYPCVKGMNVIVPHSYDRTGGTRLYLESRATNHEMKWDKFAAGVNYNNFVATNISASGSIKVNNNNVLTTADKGIANGIATLDSTGRVPYSQLPESAMEYKGAWDASTNTPALADGTGTNGDFYVVSVAGTVTFSAGRSITFYVNDRVIYDGTLQEWERLPAGEVRSVNGQTGDVVLSIPAAQVNSDWNATSGVAQILNKPTIPTVVDTVADGNMNAVTSNAVYDYIDAAITQVLNTGF